MGEKTQEIVIGNRKTSYQVWKLVEKSFTKSNESRKLELKKKLNELKIEEEQDICIFIVDLQNTIEELENNNLSDNDLEKATKEQAIADSIIVNNLLSEALKMENNLGTPIWSF